jgi:hypothetical protein
VKKCSEKFEWIWRRSGYSNSKSNRAKPKFLNHDVKPLTVKFSNTYLLNLVANDLIALTKMESKPLLKSP